MADELSLKLGKNHQTAMVRRIVPGKLVYVELKPEEVYAVKLNNIMIRKSDGSYDHYRGEPLSTLGLDSGKTVTVWTDNEGMAPGDLFLEASPGSHSKIGSAISSTIGSTTVGSTISNVALNAFKYFKGL